MGLRMTFFFLFGLGAGLGGWRWHERYHSGVLRVTFLDVGQGDSALIEFPRGKTLLVDAGGGYLGYDKGAAELVPELTRRGILALNAAVLTHPDQDHGYGFLGLWGRIQVGEWWFNARFLQLPVRPLFWALRLEANRLGIQPRPFTARTEIFWDGVAIQAIPLLMGKGTNDLSLVLALEFAGCRVLLTGDIEAPGERELLGKGIKRADLLKVAHHGSLTSSTLEFVRAVAPRWAVVSVGMDNTYRHPRSEVLFRFTEAGTSVLRTDFHGFVEMTLASTGEIRCRTSHGDCGTARCGTTSR